jgi:hypothetical protein
VRLSEKAICVACAQDLQLLLGKEEVEGGYKIVARAGKLLQQMTVATTLSRDAMRAALAELVRRL